MAHTASSGEVDRDRGGSSPSEDPKRERLQRYLARAGIGSRRKAEALIRAGRVQINNKLACELGMTVDLHHDRVSLDGRSIKRQSTLLYLAVHKPLGFITTHRDPQGRPTVLDLLPEFPGILFVGRLDAESEGLLLATTDGHWSQRIQHPSFGCEKEYLVSVSGRLSTRTLKRLRRPMDLGEGDWSSGAGVSIIESTKEHARLQIILREGRKRQIRRMCRFVGLDVLRLIRVRVGTVKLGSLEAGRWRHLSETEVGTGLVPKRQ